MFLHDGQPSVTQTLHGLFSEPHGGYRRPDVHEFGNLLCLFLEPRSQCEIQRFAVELGCGRHDDGVLKRLSCASMRVRDDADGRCEHVYWYRPVLHRHTPECDF